MRTLGCLFLACAAGWAGGLDKGCTRARLEALVQVAEKNAGSGEAALEGDRLFDHYVTSALTQSVAAAKDAASLDRELRAGFAALGLLLDDGQLSALPTGKVFADIESQDLDAAGRRFRGKPTCAGREDLARHFVLSAAIAAAAGEGIARMAGMAKEMEDMHALDRGKGSGFSFVDLAADEAGIRFASWLLTDPEPRLARLKDGFKQADAMPALDGLPEGLRTDEFDDSYGPVGSKRYNAVWKPVEERIAALRLYQEEAR